MCSKTMTETFTSNCSSKPDDNVARLREAIQQADAVLIGAGAGLSAAAGMTYDGERFVQYFSDFRENYGIRDIYSGGFYPFPTLEEYWAWWSRSIYYNRYVDAPKPVYQQLLKLVENKEYFVLTTNVDHCFQKAGFDKARLFYTQGDFGLWQCSGPCHLKTYDNEQQVLQMVQQQKDMRIPTELIPYCPVCGKPMTMNLRCDDTFVEDAGWNQAAQRYGTFLHQYQDSNILYLELGVGSNTPSIIKYPFWSRTRYNPDAIYACINDGQAYAPEDLEAQAICINQDIGTVLQQLLAE